MVSESDVRFVFEEEMGESVLEMEFLEEGIEESVRIETAAGNVYVVKIYENSVYDSPEGFLAGVNLLERVSSETNIPVPEVFVVSDGLESRLGTPFYIMSYVEGTHFDGDSESVGGELQKQIIYEAGKYLGELHSLDCRLDTYGWLGWKDDGFQSFESVETNEEFFKYMLCEDFFTDLEEKAESDDFRFSDMLGLIEETSELAIETTSFSAEKAFCHPDIKYDNLLIQEQESQVIAAVLDWANPIAVDPLFNIFLSENNLILQYNVLGEISPSMERELRSEFRTGYAEASPFEFDFNSTDVQHRLKVYEYYTVLSSLKFFELWFADFCESDKRQAEAYYRKKIVDCNDFFTQ